MARTRLSLFSVFFTFFVDNLCWSIVFPILAPYFLDPHNQIFSKETSDAMRTAIFSLFLMAYSLGQFLGAPLLGEYADRHGRKKALGVSVLFTLVGLVLSAWSMEKGYLVWLFLGRLITGVFASNMSICLAAVSDLSENEKAQVKNFGYLSVCAGLSFVLGAFLGGKLSDPTVNVAFSPYLPLWIASGLTVINLLFVLFGFEETGGVQPDVKYNFFESFANIKKALKTEKIKKFYAIYFLFFFSWTILLQFIPILVVRSFDFTGSSIGNLSLYMGFCWAVGSGYLNRVLTKYFSPLGVLEFCLVSFTAVCALIIFPNHLYGVLILLGLCVILGGLAWPLCTNVISNLAGKSMQGKVLGMSQSMQSLAMTVAPLVGGVAYQGYLGLPFLLGAFASFVASIIYFSLKDRK
ncbi:MAG: MFS transporter [Chlamydiia bacterium]|nr:MFS transporter [Chlamydiia bacterium]